MLECRKNILCCVMMALVLIGGLNWGLIGLFNLNVVALLFGSFPIVEKIIYILVGVSAIGIIIKMVRHGCSDSCMGEKK